MVANVLITIHNIAPPLDLGTGCTTGTSLSSSDARRPCDALSKSLLSRFSKSSSFFKSMKALSGELTMVSNFSRVIDAAVVEELIEGERSMHFDFSAMAK